MLMLANSLLNISAACERLLQCTIHSNLHLRAVMAKPGGNHHHPSQAVCEGRAYAPIASG